MFKNAKVNVWDEDSDKKCKRYFAHFDEYGNIYCFLNGHTSWVTDCTEMWRNFELSEKESK